MGERWPGDAGTSTISRTRSRSSSPTSGGCRRPAARRPRRAAGADRDRGSAVSEPELVVVSADEQRDAGQLAEALPATLPVLPLKETVVFPDSMTPLAIGQERSIKLIDDVVG